MAQKSEQRSSGGLSDVLDDLPTDELKDQTRELMAAMGEHAMVYATEKVGDLTQRLAGFVEHGGLSRSGSDGDGSGGDSPMKHLLKAGAAGAKGMIMDKLGGSGSGSGGGKGSKAKTTIIIEQIEVGVPVRVAYDTWTQFQDFPKFAKKIENVKQESDEKVSWKAGIYFSHRRWESTIEEQIPDERIVWRSEGEKGYVDGTVTFHETAPNLTKILVVLEYHPQGLFERTGNAFRSQRRRARLELQRFDNHIMRHVILDQEDVEGWRGEIRDSEVVRSHEEALEDEESEDDEYRDEDEGAEDEEGEYGDEEEEGEQAEDEDEEYADEDEDQEYRNEADEDEGEDEEEEDEGYRGEDEEDEEYRGEDEDEEEGEYEDEEDEGEYEGEYEDEYEPEDEEVSDRDGGRSSRSRRREPALSR